MRDPNAQHADGSQRSVSASHLQPVGVEHVAKDRVGDWSPQEGGVALRSLGPSGFRSPALREQVWEYCQLGVTTGRIVRRDGQRYRTYECWVRFYSPDGRVIHHEIARSGVISPVSFSSAMAILGGAGWELVSLQHGVGIDGRSTNITGHLMRNDKAAYFKRPHRQGRSTEEPFLNRLDRVIRRPPVTSSSSSVLEPLEPAKSRRLGRRQPESTEITEAPSNLRDRPSASQAGLDRSPTAAQTPVEALSNDDFATGDGDVADATSEQVESLQLDVDAPAFAPPESHRTAAPEVADTFGASATQAASTTSSAASSKPSDSSNDRPTLRQSGTASIGGARGTTSLSPMSSDTDRDTPGASEPGAIGDATQAPGTEPSHDHSAGAYPSDVDDSSPDAPSSDAPGTDSAGPHSAGNDAPGSEPPASDTDTNAPDDTDEPTGATSSHSTRDPDVPPAEADTAKKSRLEQARPAADDADTPGTSGTAGGPSGSTPSRAANRRNNNANRRGKGRRRGKG